LIHATARRCLVAATLFLAVSSPASAQERRVPVTIVDLGPGFAGRIVQSALASPHILIEPAATPADLPRGRRYEGTVVVLGRDATVASHVRGSVIVVGGDLFVRPGAFIEGRAVAIGGTATGSSLAVVQDGRLSYRDETFDVERLASGGYSLRYRRLSVPARPSAIGGLIAGIQLPTYDRIDGLSLGYAPTFGADAAIELQPGVTYRSHLGELDPSLGVRARIDRRTRVEGWAGRGSFSNDTWIFSDLVNSVTSLALGKDTRNWFRARRAEARLIHLWEGTTWEHEPFFGARWERASSVARDSGSTSTPWSLFGRTDDEGMRRFNPAIADGTIVSALAGFSVRWQPSDLRVEGQFESEVGLESPTSERFAQFTANARLGFPTFGTHSYLLELHAVGTTGAATPPQRYAYLGGTGTLRTLDLFEQGGDPLLFIENRYIVPLTAPRLPVLGPPTISFRHLLGAAGVDELPSFEQEIGLRVTAGLLRGDVIYNPGRELWKASIGVSFTR
jgi:hypothetical protein